MVSILIVDDERSTREGLKNNVDWGRLGIGRVLLSRDGEEALSVVRRETPDILLTDVKMPHMTGIKLAETVLSENPKTQVIFLSAYKDIAYYKSAIKLKVLDYIEKPIDLDEFSSVMLRAVGNVKQRRRDAQVDQFYFQDYSNSKPAVLGRCLVEKLLEGGEGNEIDSLCALLELPFPLRGSYQAALIEIRTRDELEDEFGLEGKNDVYQLLFSIFNQRVNTAAVLGGETRFVVLHRMDAAPFSLADGYAFFLKTLLDRHGEKYLTTVSLGEPCRERDLLRQSLDTAKKIAGHRFYMDKSGVVTADILKLPPRPIRASLTDQLFDSLRRKNYGETAALLQSLKSELRVCSLAQIPEIQTLFFRVYLTLSASENAPLLSLPPLQSNRRALESLSALVDYMAELLTCVQNSYRFESGARRAVSAAAAYIGENYAQELTLQDIAGHVYLTPAYLCTAFKRYTGMTISRYIAEERIRHAIERITGSGDSLASIAEKVGFSDPNYFTKVFRRVTGKTPSDYRSGAESARNAGGAGRE